MWAVAQFQTFCLQFNEGLPITNRSYDLLDIVEFPSVPWWSFNDVDEDELDERPVTNCPKLANITTAQKYASKNINIMNRLKIRIRDCVSHRMNPLNRRIIRNLGLEIKRLKNEKPEIWVGRNQVTRGLPC